MATNNERAELRGTITRIRWECPEGSGRAILELTDAGGETISVVGRTDTANPRSLLHAEVHVVGVWKVTDRWGVQIQADGIVRVEPRTEKGIVKYLREVLAGMTEPIARRMWTRFRERTPEVIRQNPMTLVDEGLTHEGQVRAWSNTLNHMAAVQETYLSLSSLFAGRRMPRGLISDCIGRWGTRAAEVIRTDPYILLTLGHSVGFARTDALYLEMGGNPHRLKRQTLYLIHLIRTNRVGHTWLRATDLGNELATELQKRGSTAPRVVDAIKLGLRVGRLAKHRDQDGVLWITTMVNERDETDVADKAMRMLTTYAPIGMSGTMPTEDMEDESDVA